jgi:hypothetical protein
MTRLDPARVKADAPRIYAPAAAYITGDTLRTIQAKAAAGEIPGARKNLAGRWTFDEATLVLWIEDRNDELWRTSEKRRPVRTGAGKRSGVASRSPAEKSSGAYEQAIQRLRKAAAKPDVSVR